VHIIEMEKMHILWLWTLARYLNKILCMSRTHEK
jgi:hypothetical protein